MTMPGRAVCASIRTRSRVRSISMRLMPACGSCPSRYSRIRRSASRYSLYCFSENQRDFQSVWIPRRKPYG